MLVPAKRDFLTPQEVASLRKGSTSHIDSSLGGAYDVEIVAIKQGSINVKITNIDHEHYRSIPIDTAHNVFFNLVPDYSSLY